MVTLGDVVMILDLHRQGLSLSAIARRTGLDRKTVRTCIKRGLEPPVYAPRPPRDPITAPWQDYLRQRLQAVPELTAKRLLREIRDLGYSGGYTAVKDYVRTVRPAASPAFERRFETPAGRQAQVDFAHFRATFTDEPGTERVVWLFSFVLGHSRFLWGRFVPHQDLQTVLRCLAAAFNAIGGGPEQVLFDRMKTAVQGDGDEGIVYNKTLLAFAAHHGFVPKACRPYRAKTKGKVERPFRYVRQDFFLGRTFRTLEDLNRQFDQWREEEANARLHATTRRIVAEHFAEEQPSLKPLPAGPFRAVLSLERRVTRDGMVSVGGNLYSVPDCTRRRAVEVHVLADEIRILEDDTLIASHPVLDGRGLRRIADGHRTAPPPSNSQTPRDPPPEPIGVEGSRVPRRPLDVYAEVGRRLAEEARP
ncbi:IS21 family transposase [Roseospira navarrensis]|uniref:IS21 family transposase n=1 Tax=Roseospira navarrensis TaxID=140058 RepID=A0A7X1ZGA8_9PROT|nr:IS21 family transposase [Roseospira navarrensis]